MVVAQGNAQLINCIYDEPIDGFYRFTNRYISSAKIKAIAVKTSIKDEGVAIKDTYARRFWYFDNQGNLLVFRRRKGFSSDTLRIENVYNENGELQLEFKGDIYGRYKTRYFFGQNRIEKEKQRRTSVSGETNRELTFTYVQHTDTLLETIAQTPEGKASYRQIRRESAKGLLEYSARLSDHSQEELRIYFEYDENQRLNKKRVEEQTVTGAHNITVTHYFYDAEERLGSERKHKNGAFYKRVEYLYEGVLLKAKLEKNGSNGRIVIHEFAYTFFD